MIIINSAAYVIPEFRAEFGKIPPCLLPIGNRKLLELQVPLLCEAFGEKVYVSLPEGYKLSLDERQLFEDLKVTPAYVPEEFTLAEALLFVLNTIPEPLSSSEPLRLLHGDTLLDNLPEGVDLIAISATEDDYSWEEEKQGGNHPLVWCGYFSFSNSRDFVKSLALSRDSFVKAVRNYGASNTLAVKEVLGWHDLGHINTYFNSRSKITTQRVFNSLRIENGIVWKSGSPFKKISAEAFWFKSLPPSLRRYTPQLIDEGFDKATGAPYYILEYLPCSPLNEVFVHGRNPDFFWKKIFKLMSGFLADARQSVSQLAETPDVATVAADAKALYFDKTLSRMEMYSKESGVNLDENRYYDSKHLGSLNHIAIDCVERVLMLPVICAVLHGDFCFSNILFDSRGELIKVIDPRGLNQLNELTVHGDQKYDLAKASHSVIGLYDFIIAGRYQLTTEANGNHVISFPIDERLEKVQMSFLDFEFLPGCSVKACMPLTVLLFLSMLPLHSDRPDRQRAMLANALRLYAEYVLN